MKTPANNFFFFILLLITIISCDESEEVTINKLQAVAGPDQQVAVNTPVTLDGSASTDGNNKPFTFQWMFKTKPAESNAILQSGTSAIATFTPDQTGRYVLQLIIRQNNFVKTDEVVVNVNDENTEPSPVTIIIDEDVNADRTLSNIIDDPATPDYRVTESIRVRAKLVIEPGVVIEFDADKKLEVFTEGSLTAIGEADKKILFAGKERTKGYWQGILVHSNSLLNRVEYVTVSDAGSNVLPGMPTNIKANVAIAGSGFSGGSLQVINSTFANGSGYGLYVQGLATLPEFSGNIFTHNAGNAMYLPAAQLHTLDDLSHFLSNGYNGVETGGNVQREENVIWKKFLDGSRYLISSDLTILSGVNVLPGSYFELAQGVTIEVKENGFFNASGAAGNKIIFTSKTPAQNQYWTGILYRSTSELNKLDYVDILHAGFEPLPVFTALKANVAITGTGKASITNSTIGNGLGWGIAAEAGSQLNENVITVNSYVGLAAGNVKLPETEQPETTTLVGDWVDEWSFNHQHFSIYTEFYNSDNNVWFEGASDPWAMDPASGFGLKVSDDGSYVWTIAAHGPLTGCVSYNAEHIEGQLTSTETTLTFVEESWRTKFYNSCDPDQNVDMDVQPGGMSLEYEINRTYDVFSGEPSWQLKVFNPDGSSFVYYRK
jgi:hypothetical protein